MYMYDCVCVVCVCITCYNVNNTMITIQSSLSVHNNINDFTHRYPLIVQPPVINTVTALLESLVSVSKIYNLKYYPVHQAI